MYKRVNLQPDPMRDYYLRDKDGTTYLGRWVVSNTFEGWYIKDVSAVDDEWCPMHIKPKVISQKKLKIVDYYENDSSCKVRKYIPKRILDDCFRGSDEIAGFCNPDIVCYL